jgi:hypothetical protein
MSNLKKANWAAAMWALCTALWAFGAVLTDDLWVLPAVVSAAAILGMLLHTFLAINGR